MFAIFQNYPQWSWESLPKNLTESVHMTLDNPICKDDQEVSNHDDHDLNIPVEESQTIPVHSTPGAQVYRLQKQIEEALGRCRSLAFLTNDATCLQQALTQCKVVMDTLISSATETSEPHTPPVFHSIAQAGVEEFRNTTKTMYRKGMKRKRNVGLSAESDSKCHALNPLSDITNRGPGRPRQKRLRKKPFQFPRQVSSQVKPKMLKAASLVQRGACMYKQCVSLTMSPTCACNCYNSYSKTSGLYTKFKQNICKGAT